MGGRGRGHFHFTPDTLHYIRQCTGLPQVTMHVVQHATVHTLDCYNSAQRSCPYQLTTHRSGTDSTCRAVEQSHLVSLCVERQCEEQYLAPQVTQVYGEGKVLGSQGTDIACTHTHTLHESMTSGSNASYITRY